MNGKSSGIPQGLKFSIKGSGVITDTHGGHLRLSYRIQDFAEYEEFRILINGELKRLQRDDTVAG